METQSTFVRGQPALTKTSDQGLIYGNIGDEQYQARDTLRETFHTLRQENER